MSASLVNLDKQSASAASAIGHNRLCNVEDFADPRLRDVIRDVFDHEIDRLGADFPRGREYRKYWEVAMAVRALVDYGVAHQEAEVLGVGAGNEPTLFWLTNHVRRVFATDIYADESAWNESSHASMLVDPGAHWPFVWNPRRLVVQHMNGLDLKYEDNTFDGVFSSSSIEHFGTLDDVARAAAEICRVLRPGGVASISTEFLLEGPRMGWEGCLMFDLETLRRRIIDPLPWSLVSPLDTAISPATLAAEVPFDEAAGDVARHVAQRGCLVFHKLTFTSYPSIVLRKGDLLWTSVHLCLRKDA